MSDRPNVVVTHAGKDYDLSRIYRTMSWSGSSGQMAREFEIDILTPGTGRNVPEIPAEKRDLIRLAVGGEQLLYGYITKRKEESEALTMALGCLDRGWHLSRNKGWYSFRCTPEQATRAICADFGVPVGTLAPTGVVIARKFPGVALHRIINTMYTKAAESTGKQYLVRFDGTGALCVLEKPETAGGLVLASRSNLMSRTITEDISDICTSVAIYSDSGRLIQTINNDELRSAYGLFQHVITQRSGSNARDEAKAWLDDHGEQQTVTAECLGDPRLITGTAVTLRAGGTSGLFWIDSDVHTWKNGQYVCKLGLNFRRLMAKDTAGKEI